MVGEWEARMARVRWPRWALQQLCVLLRARPGEQSVVGSDELFDDNSATEVLKPSPWVNLARLSVILVWSTGQVITKTEAEK